MMDCLRSQESSSVNNSHSGRYRTFSDGAISPTGPTDHALDMAGSDMAGYTELLQGSVPCPTCRGVGSIPKEQEGMLVALIPMKDSRLRPRRTHIWVCLAVFVSLTVAGLLIFFILPRSVNITTTQPYLDPVGPVYINVSEGVVTFKLSNRFNVSNQNYFEITVNSVLMTVLYDTKVLAETKNTSLIAIPMRSNRLYNVDIGITFDRANQMDYMVYSCQNPIRWAHELVMLFQFTCSYSVLGHSEESTLNTYQFVSCYSDIKPSTIAPVITTTNSTTTTVTMRPAPTAVTASNVTNVPP